MEVLGEDGGGQLQIDTDSDSQAIEVRVAVVWALDSLLRHSCTQAVPLGRSSQCRGF